MPNLPNHTHAFQLDEQSFFETRQFAAILKKRPQTIRKEYCLRGNAYGLVPKKVGNRLLWCADDIRELLGKK